ncbi:transposable element Tcb1 transposase [Trichonephila clavipes]|nr:transposable element Tcb1 transposase [Trichonephila clavipes]
MSPIEHEWDIVGWRIARDLRPVASTDELWLRIQTIWNTLPQTDIKNSFNSMPRRVAALIAERVTRGLLATDHVILNHGQVTWTTPELGSPSPNYHTTPREDVSALDRFNVHRCPSRRVFSGTGLELVTKQAMYCCSRRSRSNYLLAEYGIDGFTTIIRNECQRDISGVLRPVALLLTRILRNPTFKQNNARPHVAGIVRTFLDLENVRLLSWPACSPYLSPIKNIWSMVAESLARHLTPVTTVDELWYHVEAAWSSEPVHAIQSLFDSMRRCISAVITARGGCIWY